MRYVRAERSRFGACRTVGGHVGHRRRGVSVMWERAGWYGGPIAVAIAAAALLPTAAVAADPVTFSATGAGQTYTVPPGVTSITVDGQRCGRRCLQLWEHAERHRKEGRSEHGDAARRAG